MSSSPPLDTRDPFARANSLPELLSWDDVDFVRCAFVTVLGRPPELQAECFYTGLLHEGHSKRDLLWKLRRSGEGRRHDPAIAGFDRALKRAARQRTWPWLFALSDMAERDGPRDRRHRAQLNEMALLRLAQVEQNQLLAGILGQGHGSRFKAEHSHVPVEGAAGASLPPEVDGRRSGIGQSSRERHVLALLTSGIEER